MKPRNRHGPGDISKAAFVAIVCSFLLHVPLAAAPALVHVSVLSPPGRASLVLEMSGPVERVFRASGDETTVIIEAGPIERIVSAQDLTSASDAPVIYGVSIRVHEDSNHHAFMRVRIRLSTACRTAVRTNGRRIYVDVVPLEAPRAVPDTTAPLAARDKQEDTLNHRTSAREASDDASANPGDALDPAYTALEANVLRRASALSRRPDVYALVALSAEVARRDEQLGRQRPSLVKQLLAEVERYTNEARALRLKLDSLEFRRQKSTARPPQN
jgi:hypothetical protein